jgi:hypothetical protein
MYFFLNKFFNFSKAKLILYLIFAQNAQPLHPRTKNFLLRHRSLIFLYHVRQSEENGTKRGKLTPNRIKLFHVDFLALDCDEFSLALHKNSTFSSYSCLHGPANRQTNFFSSQSLNFLLS